MFYPGNSNYVFADENQTAFGGSFCVDENTKMLSIPTNAIDATEKKFNVMNPISFAIFDQYEVEAFTQNPSSNVAQYVLSIDEKSVKTKLITCALFLIRKRLMIWGI